MKLPWDFCSPLDFEHIGTNHVEFGGETKPESTFEDSDVFGRTPGARPNASRHWSEHGRDRRRIVPRRTGRDLPFAEPTRATPGRCRETLIATKPDAGQPGNPTQIPENPTQLPEPDPET